MLPSPFIFLYSINKLPYAQRMGIFVLLFSYIGYRATKQIFDDVSERAAPSKSVEDGGLMLILLGFVFALALAAAPWG